LLQRQNLRQYVMVAAPFLAALAIGIGIAAWWMVSPNAEDSARNVPAIAANGAVTAASRASASTQPRSPPKAEEDPNAYFSGKVQELKDAGNWNVLVLFASEWTRKKPDNATAWKELSLGYSIMRQHRDALEAGNKAAQLAPDDPQAWRNLGQVNIDLNEPEAALKAFERAVALDELDVHSLLEVGALGTQLNQLPKARAAYERALALNPNDAEALCGMALLAQRQARGMDADAAAKQMRGADRNCRDATGSAAVAVAPQKASSAPRK
jgi:tetratricopeptide (TPR) repeat protein